MTRHNSRGDDGRYRPRTPEEEHSVYLAQLLTGRRPERPNPLERHDDDLEAQLAAVQRDRALAERRLQAAQTALAAHEAANRALDAEAELALGL